MGLLNKPIEIILCLRHPPRNNKAPIIGAVSLIFGGSGEIRTHGGLTPSSVFKTGALNRSATLPCAQEY